MILPIHEATGSNIRDQEPAPFQAGERVLENSIRRPLRVAYRVAWLGAELILAAARYGIQVRFDRRKDSGQTVRALWFQNTCRRISRVFNIELQTNGPIPTRGLLVSNHLGYLDILVLGSLAPVMFVSKYEVRNWPVFGWF